MKAKHIVFSGLVMWAQLLLLGVGGFGKEGTDVRPFMALALVLGIPGYAWAIRSADIGLTTSSRNVRRIVLWLVAVGLSFVGLVISVLLLMNFLRSRSG